MTAFESDIEFFSSNSIKVGIFSDIPLEQDYIPGDILYYTIFAGFLSYIFEEIDLIFYLVYIIYLYHYKDIF